MTNLKRTKKSKNSSKQVCRIFTNNDKTFEVISDVDDVEIVSISEIVANSCVAVNSPIPVNVVPAGLWYFAFSYSDSNANLFNVILISKRQLDTFLADNFDDCETSEEYNEVAKAIEELKLENIMESTYEFNYKISMKDAANLLRAHGFGENKLFSSDMKEADMTKEEAEDGWKEYGDEN